MTVREALDLLRDYIRPLSVVALLGALLLGAIVSGVLEAIWPGVGVRFTVGIAGWFTAIPDAYYQLTGTLAGVYMAAREVGKWTERKYSPRPKAEGDEIGPDAAA